MTGRERVRAAMRYQAVDCAPLQYYYTPVGFYEHGEKLNDLFATLPGDFEPFIRHEIPILKPQDFDENGSYHSFEHDAWGTVWERRIFGIAGIPSKYPLENIDLLDEYRFPEIEALSPARLAIVRKQASAYQSQYYKLQNVGTLLERLRALRRDEDVLCDIALNEPKIHQLADRIVDYYSKQVELAIATGADGISFGDDYGTEQNLLIGPEMWRSFFKPRLVRLFKPAVDKGLDIMFHSCGKIMGILPDLREIGATAIWPQLPAYNMNELAQRCRELGLAVAIHTDRANAMTYGTPAQVRDLVLREFDTFRMMDGGSWFYVEADNGFPYENIEALVNTIANWR